MATKSGSEQERIRSNLYNEIYKGMKQYKKGIVELATGVGKSMLAANFINLYIKSRSSCKAIIIVNSDALRTQWKERYIDKLGLVDTVVETKQEAVKKGNRTFDVVIYDEGDEYVCNPLYGQVYDLLEGNYMLSMSAYFGDKQRSILESKGYKHLVKFDRADAEKHKLITPTIVHNVGLELSRIEKAKVEKLTNEIIEHISWFPEEMGNDVFKIYDKSFADYARLKGVPLGVFTGKSKQLREALEARDKLTLYHPLKIEAASKILEHYKESRCITFGNSIDAAVELQKKIGGEIYHSGLKSALYNEQGIVSDIVEGNKVLVNKRWMGTKEIKKEYPDTEYVSAAKRKDYIINRYKEGKVRIIHSAKALNRGLDIEDTNLGIRLSRNNSVEDMLQCMGRVREVGTYIELYFIGTNEEKKLKSIQRGKKLNIMEYNYKDYIK